MLCQEFFNQIIKWNALRFIKIYFYNFNDLIDIIFCLTITKFFYLFNQSIKTSRPVTHLTTMKYELAKYETKKHQIINATFKRMYDSGMSGITMRSIAKEAKVNQALLHYYFKDKENLLAEFIRVLFNRFIYDIEKRYKASDPPLKKLEAFFEAGRDFVESQKELFVVFIDVWPSCFRDASLQNNFADLNRKLTGVMQNIIVDGKKEGVFNEVGEDTLSIFFVAFVIGIGYLWHMDNRSFNLSDHFDIITRNLRQIIIKDNSDKVRL